MTAKKSTNQICIPDSSYAEKWLTPDVFLFQGQLFLITTDYRVVRLSQEEWDRIERESLEVEGGVRWLGR